VVGLGYAGNNSGRFSEAVGPRIAATQQPGKWRQLDNVSFVSIQNIQVLITSKATLLSSTYTPTLTRKSFSLLPVPEPRDLQWIRFFKKPDYDVSVAEYADANKQPIAINELISLGVLQTKPVNFAWATMVHLPSLRYYVVLDN
jgi:hypothetical protein